jgi:hypothetical protein
MVGPIKENRSALVKVISTISVHKPQVPFPWCMKQGGQPPSEIAVTKMDESGCIGQPPSYRKYSTSTRNLLTSDRVLMSDRLDGGGSLLGDKRDLVVLPENSRGISVR